MSALAAPSTEASPSLYPGGVWRVPIALVLEATSSAYVGVIRKRAARGDRPDEKATVWRQGGRWFAHVMFERPQHSALIFELHAWAGREPPACFGRKGPRP